MSLSRYLAGLIIVAVGVGVVGIATSANAANGSSADSARVLELYFQIQKLKDRLRRMQGEIQELRYQLAQNRRLAKKNYQNLVKRLEGGAKVATTDKNQSGRRQTPADAPAREPTNGQQGAGEQVASASQSTSDRSNADSNPQQSAESSTRAQYLDAFNLLKNGKYDQAAAAFLQFARKHPQTGLTDNAYYWRGESLYVQQQYDKARKAFVRVTNDFPDSPKVADSLYKIAVIDIGSGEKDNAKAILERVTEEYSGSRAARMAQDKLTQLGS